MHKESHDRDLVRRLLAHIERGTTDMADSVLSVPDESYTQERLARELDVLFFGRPLVLCLTGALPGPGSYRTVEACGTPVLLARSDDGTVRAMANICRHRGARVVDGAGRAGSFTCPLHAWTYDLDGHLADLPGGAALTGICREEKGLVELPVAEAHGLVMGRLRPGAPVDIDTYLGPELAAELEMLSFADWELHGDPHVHRVEADWKVAVDTFRENYHLDYLHRNTLGGYNHGGVLAFDAFGPHLRNTSAVKSIDALRGRPEAAWEAVEPHFASQYGIFPNIVLSIDRRHIEFWQILPLSAGRCEVVHSAYVRPDLPPSERDSMREFARWVCSTVVDGEDFWVAGRTEPGIRSGLLGAMTVGMNEPGVQHAHRQYAAALAAGQAPATATEVSSARTRALRC